MSLACCATPRKKFPPPTTMANCTPSLWTSLSSAAIPWMRAVSTPKPWLAASASPDNLSRTRLKAGVGVVMKDLAWPAYRCKAAPLSGSAGVPPAVASAPRARRISRHKKGAPQGALRLLRFRLCRLGDRDGLARVPNLEPRKTPHGDVLAQLADLGRDQLRDRDGLILDERLFEQADFLIELLHLAGNHFLRDVRRLAAGNCLR